MRTMAAGEFKAKCLGVMTEVNSTGQPCWSQSAASRSPGFARGGAYAAGEPEAIFGCLRHMGTITETSFRQSLRTRNGPDVQRKMGSI